MEANATGLRLATFEPTGLAGTGVVRAWLWDTRVADVRALAERYRAARP
jgi:hypothetical protein